MNIVKAARSPALEGRASFPLRGPGLLRRLSKSQLVEGMTLTVIFTVVLLLSLLFSFFFRAIIVRVFKYWW